jgi:RhtB (resistance to homoserine/threonine) family protein
MFCQVLLLSLIAGISPGPDFFIVTRNSIGYGKRIGIASSLGVAAALSIHATYSILGLTLIMQNYHALFISIQLLGAAYLAYVGITTIISSFRDRRLNHGDVREEKGKRFFEGFVNGFLCNILNPKAYIFFLSIFSQFMSPGTPMWVEWVYAFEVVSIIGLWFCFLSVVISSALFKRCYLKAEKWIERFLGAALVFFAVRITKSALSN